MTALVAVEGDRTEWNAFVSGRAAGYHDWSWRDVFKQSFGHECVYLMTRSNGRIDGVLPLVFMKSRIFGRFMSSLQFV